MLDYIEKKFSLKSFKELAAQGAPYYKDLHITVIGAGIAGIFFTRFMFSFARREKINIKITMINNLTCNYCAGLMTDIAYHAIRDVGKYELGDDVILSRLTHCVYINSKGSAVIGLPVPLASVLRTNKFGIRGFDDYLKKEILTGYEEFKDNFNLIEPAVVTDLDHIPEERKYNIYYTQKGMPNILKTDAVVFSVGLQKIHSKLIDKMKEKFGFQPPVLMSSAVTEIDLSLAKYNKMHDKVFIIDEIIPDTVIGLVSKREDWLTVSSLNRVLTLSDLEKIFNNPVIREYVHIENIKSSLKCGIVCPTYVFSGSAKNFYGQGWAAIGDLTGSGRVLKDGYFHAVKQAYYAAWTIIYKGALKVSFDKFYYEKLKTQIWDNKFGSALFRVNNFLKKHSFFNKLFIKILKNEKNREDKYFTSAIKGLITGEFSYKTISFLFFTGLMRQILGLNKIGAKK